MVQLQSSMTPVFSDGGGGRFAFETKATALVALLEKSGPAILIVHSAAGMTGFEAARRRPDLVKGIVVVEPVGCPEDATDVRNMLAGKFFYGIFGDHFEVRGMQGRLDACRTTANLVNGAGGRAEVVWLPQEGVRGNSHLLMQEDNNDTIGRRIINFLRR
jgi:pimeloyl-ACP methyl ester carboxylesterase